VLIGGFGQLRPLTAAGIRPLIVSRRRGDLLRYSRYYRATNLAVPANLDRDGAQLADDLVRLARSLATPPVLFFGDDEVLRFVARYQEPLREAFRFQMPARDLVETCLDKTRFLEIARKAGLAVPRQRCGSPTLGVDDIERLIGFPCALKPATHDRWFASGAMASLGGMPQKILRADDRASCAAALATIRAHSSRFVVQQYIPGGEEQVYSFHAYVPGRPLPRVAYAGRKIRTYPSMGGESTLVQLVHAPELLEQGWRAVDRLGLTGLVKIDFKRDVTTGRQYLLEVNLRSTLWNQLGARCGINLPELAYRDACGMTYDAPAGYRTDVRWLHLARDVRTCFRDYYPSGKLSAAGWLRSYCGPMTYATFAWDDPLPGLVSWGQALRKACGGGGRRPVQEAA
jgi:predicted ATP-grasp superfamily ATP-dependent carboligase